MGKHTHTAPRTSDGGARAQACAQTEFKVADWTPQTVRSLRPDRRPRSADSTHLSHTHPTHYTQPSLERIAAQSSATLDAGVAERGTVPSPSVQVKSNWAGTICACNLQTSTHLTLHSHTHQ
ncbi:hypothetical protein CFIO01_05767 [Colletotrichum fioriniae PJ7]|uniref:Uncharacterized protein n=1 Tax=Colletotrichum fioriniae PJ7 TaxID=1445577 RepID=A0A010QGF1_9PEZI|nr:hypothetical protein CFIO01_05767 [Colletotrichum fioriniae PJ7]